MNREQKINQIRALMDGKISPAEIGPRLVIHFHEDKENVYLINGKTRDSKTFHELMGTLPAVGNLVTHGREDDSAEYYYGNVPFSIYKDNRAF